MAGKQIAGDGGLPANLAGMTKTQLYEIMSQMKALIDQNHQQAREILIRNPVLTKALFQAQIMLGMVQPPQPSQKVEPQAVLHPQQSHQPVPPKPNVQAHMSSVKGGGLQEPIATMQPQPPIRKHPIPMPSSSVPVTNTPSQPRFSHPQRQGNLNPAATSLSHQQPSQVQNAPSVPLHSTSQPPPFHHHDVPAPSTQMQQPMHSVTGPHLAQQQPRLSSMSQYHHQFGPAQTGPNVGFQHHGAPPQQHLPQPMFHSGNRPPAAGGPQFPQGQSHSHLPSQPPYQGQGSFRGDYNNNQLGAPMTGDRGPMTGERGPMTGDRGPMTSDRGPMTGDRGPSWMPGQSDSSNITQLPGLGPMPPPSQVGPGNGPPPRPAPISAEMEKALLQQVMSLTPEQINLLPPEQRNQVLQLQQILRQ